MPPSSRSATSAAPRGDALDNPEGEERRTIEVITSSVKVTGLAFSFGAVWWAARAAGLVASLLASSPARSGKRGNSRASADHLLRCRRTPSCLRQGPGPQRAATGLRDDDPDRIPTERQAGTD